MTSAAPPSTTIWTIPPCRGFLSSIGLPPDPAPPPSSLFDTLSDVETEAGNSAEARDNHSSVWHFRSAQLADAISPVWKSIPPEDLSISLAESMLSADITSWAAFSRDLAGEARLFEYVRTLPGFQGRLDEPLSGCAMDNHLYVAMPLLYSVTEKPRLGSTGGIIPPVLTPAWEAFLIGYQAPDSDSSGTKGSGSV